MQLRKPLGFLTQSLPNRGIQDCITKPTAFGARAFSTTIYYSIPEKAPIVKKFFEAQIADLANEISAN
jgi:hypothetical protein